MVTEESTKPSDMGENRSTVPTQSEVGAPAVFLGSLVWVVVVAGFAAILSTTIRTLLATWWWVLAILAVAALIISIMPWGRRVLESSPLTIKASLFVFVVLPFLIAIIGWPFAFLTNDETQASVLRAYFLVLVCILPAMMWYLFIVTRKASLLNEFLANLDRLGLLGPGQAENESEASRDRRIESYLQKFEAAYGTLPNPIHVDVLENRFRYYSTADTMGGRTLSTATYPVALFTLLIAIGWLITLPPFELGAGGTSVFVRALEPTATPVTVAFLGAYFFMLQALFRRYVLKDLGGAAYVAGCIRIILAVIGIWILSALGPIFLSSGQGQSGNSFLTWEKQLLLIGFIFGVFPRVIWQIIQSLFQRVGKHALPSMSSKLPVSDLDGLTVWHEARLEEEDIENIPNMANADLVELLLNTRLAPEQVIDWVDQAILYTQLGPQSKKGDDVRQKLRANGIRTASSLVSVAALSENKGDVHDKIMTDTSGRSFIAALQAALATNSNFMLILRWRRMSRAGYSVSAKP